MNIGEKRKGSGVVLPVIAALSTAFIAVGLSDLRLGTSFYDYSCYKVPAGFDGYRILQISDLHGKRFGKKQKQLLEAIKSLHPDMIVLTGDIIDEKRPGIRGVDELLSGIQSYAPVFYVSGNHEQRGAAKTHVALMLACMKRHGIINLDCCKREIISKNDRINVYGVPFAAQSLPVPDKDAFNILLYHGSGAFERISAYGYDLVFSGHAHGGVVRLPFIGGVLGNDRSFFPKYDSGAFKNGDSVMISSRGLGDCSIPRFFNPPELVLVTLRKSSTA